MAAAASEMTPSEACLRVACLQVLQIDPAELGVPVSRKRLFIIMIKKKLCKFKSDNALQMKAEAVLFNLVQQPVLTWFEAWRVCLAP